MSGSSMLPPSEVEHIAAEIIGPFMVGALVNMFLFGAAYIQIYIYARTCQRDPTWRKILIATVFVLDLFHVVLTCYTIWAYTIQRNGNVPAFLVPLFFPFGLALIVGALIVAIAQVFFSWRVWKVSGNRSIAAITTFTSLAQIALTVVTVVSTKKAGSFLKVQDPVIKVSTILFTTFAIVTDSMNFSALAWYLHKRRGPLTKSNDILTRMTRVFIQTGAILVLWTIIDIITYLAVPNSTTFVFLISLPNLYTNCLTSSLNARVEWGDGTSQYKVNMSIPVASRFKSRNSETAEIGVESTHPDSIASNATVTVNGMTPSKTAHSLTSASNDRIHDSAPDLFPTPAALEDGHKTKIQAFPAENEHPSDKGDGLGNYRPSEHVLNWGRPRSVGQRENLAADTDCADDHVAARAI